MSTENKHERVNYFDGQILSAAEFQVEQEYFLDRHRLHNRFLHGWGVVCGLKVTARNSGEVVVDPGVAIDCVGNEIHVCAEVRLPIARISGTQFVALEYMEIKTSPTPSPFGGTGPDPDEPIPSRIRESFRLEIVGADPAADHQGKKPGKPGCGLTHQICLASLKKRGNGWKIEQRSRRGAGG